MKGSADMGFSVKEAMTIYPLNQCVVVAGMQGMNREITATNIMEVPDVSRWMKGGELLFTAGYAFHDKQVDSTKLVEDLCKRKVAALAIKPGKYLDKIPETMILAANRIGFPIIEISEEMAYMDYMIPISERIQNEQLYVLKRIDDVHERLLRVIIEEDGFRKLCDVIGEVTCNPVYMLRREGKLREISCHDTYKEEDIVLLDIILRKTFGRRKLVNMIPNKCNMVFAGENHRRMITLPIFIQDKFFGYLIMEEKNRRLSKFDEAILEYAVSVISVELLKERSLMEKKMKARYKLLDDLVYHNYGEKDMLRRQAEYVGYDLKSRYFIFHLKLEKENHRNAKIELNEYEDAEGLEEKICHDVYHVFESEANDILLTYKDNLIVGMLSITEESSVFYVQTFLDIVYDLEKKYRFLTLSVCIGRAFLGIENVQKSMKDCEVVENVIAKATMKKKAVTFEELGITRFLCELKDYEPLQDFYQEVFGILLEYDKENKAELLTTLREYFECDRNLKKTSEKMFLHKNTVAYRMQKIRQLTGYTLENSEDILNMMICLKYAEIIGN